MSSNVNLFNMPERGIVKVLNFDWGETTAWVDGPNSSHNRQQQQKCEARIHLPSGLAKNFTSCMPLKGEVAKETRKSPGIHGLKPHRNSINHTWRAEVNSGPTGWGDADLQQTWPKLDSPYPLYSEAAVHLEQPQKRPRGQEILEVWDGNHPGNDLIYPPHSWPVYPALLPVFDLPSGLASPRKSCSPPEGLCCQEACHDF